jgi:hypothetical protein
MAEDFEDIVNYSLTVHEFERDWKKMVEDYHLENNKYFNKMWETRARFIPVYFKNDFFPFLQSTGRSEGTNSRFKDNVASTYSVISFLGEYQRIVEQVNVSEEYEDNESNRKRPKELMFGYTIERQAQEAYNRNIFKKFQSQLQTTPKLSYNRTAAPHTFEVYTRTNQEHKPHKTRRYLVMANLTYGMEEFTCVCGKFDKDGILCSHILKVIIEEGLTKIPEEYIMDRWKKKQNQKDAPLMHASMATHPVLRHNLLSRKAALLTSAAAKTEKTMQYISEELDKLQEKVCQMLSSEEVIIGGPWTGTVGGNNAENQSRPIVEILKNPEAVKQKGRPKNLQG